MSQNNFDRLVSILIGFLPLSLILGVLVSSISILLIDLIFLLYCIKNKFWNWIKHPYIKIILLLYIYLLFNNFIAIDNTLSSARNIGFIRYLIFVPAVIFFFKNTKYINIIFFIWSFIIIITAFDVYYEFFNGYNILGFENSLDLTYRDYAPYHGIRIVSFFKDELIVGGFINSFLLIIIGFLYYLNKKKNNFYKYFFLLIVILILISILITGERSNSIKAILGILTFACLYKEFKISHKIYATLFILTTIIFIIASNDYLKIRYYGQILKNFSSYEKINTYIDTNIYFKHYRSAYFVFKKNPILGVGNKNYGKSCFKDHDKIISGEIVCSTHPHQVYFELLVEHGLVGSFIIFLLFSMIIYNNLKNYFKYNNIIHLGATIYVLLTFLPLLPGGTFFGNYNSTIFWINFSIMLAFEKNLVKDKNQS